MTSPGSANMAVVQLPPFVSLAMRTVTGSAASVLKTIVLPARACGSINNPNPASTRARIVTFLIVFFTFSIIYL